MTKSDLDPESAVRCLKAMGVPFFVTRDLDAALRHKLLVVVSRSRWHDVSMRLRRKRSPIL